MAGLHTPTAINVMTLESFQKKRLDFFPQQCMTGFHSSTMKMHRDLFLIQFKIHPALGSDSSSLTDFYCPDIYFLSRNFSKLSGDKLTLHAVR